MRWLCALGLLLLGGCSRVNPLFDELGGGDDGGTLGVETSDDGKTTEPQTTDSGNGCDACNPDQLCVDGTCMCPEGLRFCGTECVDVQADGSHCGECDRLCASPTVCALGECRDDCPVGTQECGDSCPPLDSPLHCGGCGIECDPDEVCVEGDCVCPDGHLLCDGACVNTDDDPAHCGDCGRPCDSGMCMLGECLCEIGRPCAGACVDTTIDPLNCGDCGIACDQVAEVCELGDCACSPLFELCGGTCVYLPTNHGFCGDCETNCAAGQLCVGGACLEICGDPFQICGDVCTDTRFDPSHCGECDNPCDNGEACIDSECQPYDAPACMQCPCADCEAFCCELPSLSNQALCTDVQSASCA